MSDPTLSSPSLESSSPALDSVHETQSAYGGPAAAPKAQSQGTHEASRSARQGQANDVAAANAGLTQASSGIGMNPQVNASKAAAGDVRSASGMDLPPPQPLGSFDPELSALIRCTTGADLSGVTVSFLPELEQQGKLGVAQAGKTIGLSPKIKGNPRKTIRHETGHILQHPSSGVPKVKPQPGKPVPDVEQEAIQIAESFDSGKPLQIFNTVGDEPHFEDPLVSPPPGKLLPVTLPLEDRNPMAASALVRLKDYLRRNPHGAGVYAQREKNYKEKMEKVILELATQFESHKNFETMPDNLQAIIKMLNELSSISTIEVTCEEISKKFCMEDSEGESSSCDDFSAESECNFPPSRTILLQRLRRSGYQDFGWNQVGATEEDENWGFYGRKESTVDTLETSNNETNKCNMAVAEALLDPVRGAGIAAVNDKTKEKSRENSITLGLPSKSGSKACPALSANDYARKGSSDDPENKDAAGLAANPRTCLINYIEPALFTSLAA